MRTHAIINILLPGCGIYILKTGSVNVENMTDIVCMHTGANRICLRAAGYGHRERNGEKSESHACVSGYNVIKGRTYGGQAAGGHSKALF